VPTLGRDRNVTGTTNHTADSFAAFFAKKIDDVRSATAGRRYSSVLINVIIPIVLKGTSASYHNVIAGQVSCSLDPIPTFILREFIDLLLPYLTSMVDASLVQGRLPTSAKHAIVTPLLKKAGLETSDESNNRPMSNFTFISKIVERAVAMQLNDYLTSHSLLPRCQSAYKKKYSTGTAMLRVLSDLLTAADGRKITLLGLLDMSAAFDCGPCHIAATAGLGIFTI
jgi:hypothetical protein